jgi:hypothetical protein
MTMNQPYCCRFCGEALRETFVDLGMSPLCQTHIEPTRVHDMEPFYPLHSSVCNRCFLVQLPEHVGPSAIFAEYAYLSSYSDTWLADARKYVDEPHSSRSRGRDPGPHRRGEVGGCDDPAALRQEHRPPAGRCRKHQRG